jgi:hypothetical protein
MEYVGLEPGRLHFSWISSAEAEKFQRTANKFIENVRALGPLQPHDQRYPGGGLMDIPELTEKIRASAKKLLEEKGDCVIGYEEGTVPMRDRPFFAYTPEEADKLIWSSFASTTWPCF